MNHAVFELFPCLLRAKQNETKGSLPVNTGRQTKYEQWIFKGVECSKC